MGPAVRIISSLMRYGKLMKRWANQSGTRVSGRTGKSGAKVRGVLKTQPGKRKKLSSLAKNRTSLELQGLRRSALKDRQDTRGYIPKKVISGRRSADVPVVESASGGRTIVNQADASSLRKSAAVASKVRKGLIIGGVGGAGVGVATSANKKASRSSEPTYTEKNPGGMRFSKAPSLASTGIKAKQPKSSAGTFSKAFAKAYDKGKGKGTNFTWKGKKFVALTKEDTGGKTIKEYYASKKKKKK
jgi:hypothetical protein